MDFHVHLHKQKLDPKCWRIGMKELIVFHIFQLHPKILIERLSGRWTCPSCGFVYHEKFNPPSEILEFVIKIGSNLYQREDEKSETVKTKN